MATPKRRQEEYRESIVKREAADNRRTRQRVIHNSDRSSLAYQADSTRNAHSTMPGSPQSPGVKSSIPDTASNFRDTYAKAGIQPANLDEKPLPSERQGDLANRSAQVQYRNSQLMVKPGSKTYKKRIRIRRKNKAKAASAKARVTTANLTIFGWGGWIWLWLQIPIAILSTIAMAMAQAIYEFVGTLLPHVRTDEDGMVVSFMKKAIDTGMKLIEWLIEQVDTITGFDLELFDPSYLYLITILVLMAIGIITMLLTYMTYKMAFLRPLSGKKSGLKWLMFSIAIIGYGVGSMFPIFNLVPWFIFWTTVVWFYPK